MLYPVWSIPSFPVFLIYTVKINQFSEFGTKQMIGSPLKQDMSASAIRHAAEVIKLLQRPDDSSFVSQIVFRMRSF